jgi:UDP:flavonoid glycosyltransferase YjiC (YdhE family)
MGPTSQSSQSGPTSGRRIVLATFGSFGDLHPYIALALGLRARGHDPILATHEIYRGKIEGLGLGFRAVRPNIDPGADAELIRKVMDLRKGPKVVIGLFMDALRDSYEDTLAAVEGADLLVAHPLTFTARLVAETSGVRWASTILAPMGFLSVYDPPVIPTALFLTRFRPLGPLIYRPVFHMARRVARDWGRPWPQFRAELGLPPADDPLFEGQHSPDLVLALFSRHFATPQPDWPPQTVVTGFPFYDRDGEAGLSPELARFLDAGPPPIVFTLGTSAVLTAGRFYEESAEAARRLGRRAVLLVGKGTDNRPAGLSGEIAAFDYAPYSELLPRAAAIVHQGGVGTTAQALRSGRPMLVVPFAHDQPDNADRAARLGVARVIPSARYTAGRAARELSRILDDPSVEAKAAEVGTKVQAEDGVGTACDALESLMGVLRRERVT